MTVTQNRQDANRQQTEHWNLDREVEIERGCHTSFGFSIVSGKINVENQNMNVGVQRSSGVFVKSIDPDSCASDLVNLKIGDHIVEIDGINIRNSSYEHATQIIQKAGNILRLRVQSLNRQDNSCYLELPEIQPELEKEIVTENSPELNRRASLHIEHDAETQQVPSVDGNSPSLEDNVKTRGFDDEDDVKRSDSDESSDSEDERYLEGNIFTKAGIEISRKSAGNVKRTNAEVTADEEEEDEYGYTAQKIQKKYRLLPGQIFLHKIDKTNNDLGIALAGHKDRTKMGVFICGLNPKGIAFKNGGLKVGDEIIEVNGQVLQGRSHLNAPRIIRSLTGSTLKMIVRRTLLETNDVAVRPITHFPAALDEADRYSHFDGVRTVSIKKGLYGLGIMIVEGKHAEVGQGIFISDIQEGSVAEKGGLEVGDMILGVNTDTLIGSTYDQATAILKRVEGMVTIIVCNPNKNKQKEGTVKIPTTGQEPPPEVSNTLKAAISPKKEEMKQPAAIPKVNDTQTDTSNPKAAAGKPLTVEISKPKDSPLGIIVTGGTDTSSGGIFILDLFSDGIAAKSNHLQRGDRILEFNQENFKTIEREKGESCILSASGQIKMTVARDDYSLTKVEVELQRKPMKGIGTCLTGFQSGKGAYISELVPGGSASDSGKLEIGDTIVAIGDQDVQEMTADDIATSIKSSNPVSLKVIRFKTKS